MSMLIVACPGGGSAVLLRAPPDILDGKSPDPMHVGSHVLNTDGPPGNGSSPEARF